MTDSVEARLEAAVSRFEKLLNYSEVLVSCTEAARLLGKTTTTVSAMVRDGRLERVTIGKSTGIRLSDIWDIKSP